MENEQETPKGWVPENEWRGDPEQWVSAEEFVKRGETILPIVKKQRDTAQEELMQLRGELNEVKKTSAEFKEFQDTILANTKKKLQQEIVLLKEDKKVAAKDGDVEAVVRIDEQIEDRKEAVKVPEAPPVQAGQEMSPADERLFANWIEGNQWYKDNPRLHRYANSYAESITGKLRGQEFLDELTKEVNEAFPQEFNNPKRSRRDVDGGDPSPAKSGNGRTFDDLPPDAQTAATKFAKNIKGFTIKQYLETYEWD